jgi:hypothetical protein
VKGRIESSAAFEECMSAISPSVCDLLRLRENTVGSLRNPLGLTFKNSTGEYRDHTLSP